MVEVVAKHSPTATDVHCGSLFAYCAQFEATVKRISARLSQLQEVVVIFSNPAQQLETRHLASLAALPALTSLTLQASFHPEACNFSAALSPCSSLRKLVILQHEVSKGLTDGHVASVAGKQGADSRCNLHAAGDSSAAMANSS